MVSRTFAFVFSWQKIIIALFLYISCPHINHSSHDGLNRVFFRAPIFRFGLEARSNRNSNTNPFSTRCRLQTGYKMQTRYKMPTEIFKIFFRLIRDDMSSYNSPSVTQSLFRDHLSRLLALLWNIPCPFLDHNRSYYNFKPLYSLPSLRTSCFV